MKKKNTNKSKDEQVSHLPALPAALGGGPLQDSVVGMLRATNLPPCLQTAIFNCPFLTDFILYHPPTASQ